MVDVLQGDEFRPFCPADMRLSFPRSASIRSLFLVWVLAACGAPPVPVEEDGAETGDNETGGAGTTPASSSTPGTPNNTGTSGSTGAPSVAPADSSTKPPVPVPDDHVPVVHPDFPGIDVALPGETPPKGCVDGYDAEKATIQLVLDSTTPGVRLHVAEGVLHANGSPCEDDREQPLAVEGLRQVRVRGGGEANLVIVDFAEAGFGQTLFEQEGGFHFDAGQGEDALYFRGSPGDDEFYVGAANARFVAALSSIPRVNLFAKSFELVRTSLGPGDDVWAEIGRLNVGLFDLDTGSKLNIKGIDVAQRIWGGDGHDELNGGALDDEIVGGAGDDLVNGRDGNDRFIEDSRANGRDILNGGGGLDAVDYGARGEDLVIELCESEVTSGCSNGCECEPQSGEDGEDDIVVNVEIVYSGSGNDILRGGPADNYIYAGKGDDQLYGGAGSDVLQGGEGQDEFDGGDDEDICDADEDEIAISCEV